MAGPEDEPSRPSVRSKVSPSNRPPAHALIGSLLSDRYRVERLIGEGGVGAVYQAEHTLMRKRMAIKVLHPEMTRLPEIVARFEREAMAAAHIEHPNVVTATDFGKLKDGSFFLALELVEGRSLRDALAGGRLELGRALHIARQIGSALARAHGLGIVHRDLKPENVMLVERDGDPDFVKVLDFGIAKVELNEVDEDDDRKQGRPAPLVLTRAGMIYGTPEYMSPEQALGLQVDHRADLYALGCMTYEMLCGVRPFVSESTVSLLGMQVTMPVPPMATKAPEASVPPEVESLVAQLLAKEAKDRLGDARALLTSLDAITSTLVLRGRIAARFAPPDSTRHLPAVKASESFFAGKAWMLAAGGGLFCMLALVVAILVRSSSERSTETDAVAGTSSATSTNAQALPLDSIDQKVKVAIAQIDMGNYGSGIETLEALGPELYGREDAHRSLFLAYSRTGRQAEAMREVGLVVQSARALDLSAKENIVLREAVRNMALLEGHDAAASQTAIERAWDLLGGTLGTAGLDDLYDIAFGRAGAASGYQKAQARAQREILKTDRTKMSPALSVTVELHAHKDDCASLRSALDRASAEGDVRTLAVLKTYGRPRLDESQREVDRLGCIHDGSLAKATTELEMRLAKR